MGQKSLNSPIKNSDFGTAKAPYLRHILYISPNSPILFIVIKNKYKIYVIYREKRKLKKVRTLGTEQTYIIL